MALAQEAQCMPEMAKVAVSCRVGGDGISGCFIEDLLCCHLGGVAKVALPFNDAERTSRMKGMKKQ